MKRLLAFVGLCLFASQGVAVADQTDPVGNAETTPEGVRVTLVRSGGVTSVAGVTGGGTGQRTCTWTVIFSPGLEDATYGTSAGPKPDPDAQFALLLCNGSITGGIWVGAADIVDLDAVAGAEAARYVRDVLMPAVTIGVNPDAKGLAGLRSWFWIEGFTGLVQAPPISAFGMSIVVRMSGQDVTWDFGDGTTLEGDLGQAYPAESSVQHAHRDGGEYAIEATIHLVPEYSVNGGGWIGLPPLTPTATTDLPVEEREPVLTRR
jgi:hypothetical protein